MVKDNGGWGGPPRGAGTGGPARGGTFQKGNTFNQLKNTPEAVAKRQRKEEQAEQLREHLYHLAFHSQREDIQVSATNAWLDRHEGKPVQSQTIDAKIEAPTPPDHRSVTERIQFLLAKARGETVEEMEAVDDSGAVN